LQTKFQTNCAAQHDTGAQTKIIEISVDADSNEGARRPCWSFDTREKAVNRINNLLSRCKSGRFNKEKIGGAQR